MRWAFSSAASLINGHVRDPRLRALLAAQCGDHGLPPSLAPAPIHAAVASHYFHGGYYPKGGGGAIPRAFIRGLRKAGGEIRVRTAVDRILLEGNRAIGVRLADGTELRAPVIVSNADPSITFGKLIGREHLPGRLRARLDRTRYSVSAISLFLAADFDARAAGLDSGNTWFYESLDIDALYKMGLSHAVEHSQDVPGFFLTVTSLKDPTKNTRGMQTMEAFTFVDYDVFEKWAASSCGDRPEAYNRLKEDIKQRMLRAVSRVIPGIERKVVFADVATPLTNVHYVAATRGNLYGTEKRLRNIGPWAYSTTTRFGGLYLCGASTLGHGVMGATVSGLIAARSILGCRLDDLLRKRGPALRVYQSEAGVPSDKTDANRTRLSA